ncbi:MAG: hypothetical protein L6R42_010633, partial [Xanthoria sp. 1 TBL-2021]
VVDRQPKTEVSLGSRPHYFEKTKGPVVTMGKKKMGEGEKREEMKKKENTKAKHKNEEV